MVIFIVVISDQATGATANHEPCALRVTTFRTVAHSFRLTVKGGGFDRPLWRIQEMTEITALHGSILHIDVNSITIVAGPFPGDPPDRSYVTGPGPAAIATNEDAETLVARLTPKAPLAKLTRPNKTPVWIQGSAVTLVRRPIVGDTPPGETVGAVLFIGDNHQAVVQDLATACSIVNSHGGNV
jgi:hypothetical protein